MLFVRYFINAEFAERSEKKLCALCELCVNKELFLVPTLQIVTSKKSKFGTKQADADPPVVKLLCFGKVGYSRYKQGIREVLGVKKARKK